MKKEVLSGISNSVEITKLFNDYFKLHTGYINNYYLNKTELFQKRADEWKLLFNKVFALKHVTP